MTADRTADDEHLPYSSSSPCYNFDLYGGILTKTSVEQRSIFYLFFNKVSTRNVLWSKIDLIVSHVSYFKFKVSLPCNFRFFLESEYWQ